MDSIRRIAGRGKAKVPSAVKKDKDESVVFFSELYKRDKERETSWNRISSEKTKPCTVDKMPTYAAITNRQRKATAPTAPTASTASRNATNKH